MQANVFHSMPEELRKIGRIVTNTIDKGRPVAQEVWLAFNKVAFPKKW